MRALTAAILLLVVTSALVAQRTGTSAPPLPPVVMTCAHHPDVLESKPGTCPYCKLPLVPVRIDSAWMCPVHTDGTQSNNGTCRRCGRRLVPVTVSLTWTCTTDRTIEHLEPGTCADGSARVGRRTLRAHGNHNPQHGGQFFMAPDNWHHLEGVHPSARVFRLFVYDDYGRPLTADAVNRIQARVVTRETFDPATRKTTEITAFALKPSRNRAYLEARIDQRALPAEMTAKVKFDADQPEYRFDFTFLAFSKEPATPVARRSVTEALSPSSKPATSPATASATAPAAAGAAAAAATPAGGASSPGLDPLTPAPIPSSMSGMLEHLDIRARQVGELIARGDFSAVWVPAFQARDIAISLEPHVAHLSPEKRTTGEPALTRVVRTAWLLDAAGDVGNRAQIEAAHVAFKAAVAEVLTAFGDVR